MCFICSVFDVDSESIALSGQRKSTAMGKQGRLRSLFENVCENISTVNIQKLTVRLKHEQI